MTKHRLFWGAVVIVMVAWFALFIYDPILCYVISLPFGVLAICGGLLVLAWDSDKRKAREWEMLRRRAAAGETIIVSHKGRLYEMKDRS